MKNLKIFLLFAFITAFSTMYGQGPYYANPNNYLQVAEALYQDALPRAAVTLVDVENHVQGVVNANPYNPNDLPPPLTVDEFSDAQIKVSWPLDPNADSYEVQFFNMNSGTRIIRNTTSSFTSVLNPAPGVYIVSLVKKSFYQIVLEQTAAEMHIITKDIMQFVVPTNLTECGCNPVYTVEVIPPAESLYFFVFDLIDMIAQYQDGRYRITMDYYNETQIILVITRASSGNDIEYTVNCSNGMNVELWNWSTGQETKSGHIFVHEDYSNDYFPVTAMGTAYFPYWGYENFVGNNEIQSITYDYCTIPPPPPPPSRSLTTSDFNGKKEILVYPNPATDQIQINTRSNKLGTLTITNQLGQVIHTVDATFSTEQINIAEWPKGVYFATMKLKGEKFTESFVKIN